MSEDKTLPGDPDSTRSVETPASGRPRTIGNYRLLQKLGEGGMGEVWEAEQQRPVRRRVALKLIKSGMDTRAVVSRFEAERQALALMNHPNVAKVFDAGATEQGRPYFVMEYVKGVSITEHCDTHRLTTQQRLELFLPVCDGVHHAHQKGIIHRDIKPTNVLVEIGNERAVPKIIDFGVAKATEHRLTENTVFTELGQLVGTPEYMSPEQAEMTGQDIDTRTDVYSLGVLLYELLVGALPFDRKELRQAGLDEIRRKIREDEPSKPSTRLGTLEGKWSTESAKRRRTDRPTLIRQLRRDLDWITMKALEKERTRRYFSPADVAADIQRHLRNEPVLASPPSTTYRLSKFLRRHKVGVAISSLLVVILLLTVVSMVGGVFGVLSNRSLAIEADLAKQATTIAKIRTIASAMESYRNNSGLYPVVEEISDLQDALGSWLVRQNREDGWENEILVRSDQSSYTIISLGKGGELQPDPPGGRTGTFDSDIIFSDERFIQWPEGRQK